MSGKNRTGFSDNWHWNQKNQKFRESLIHSASICSKDYNFIAICCRNYAKISELILSFSNCTTSKYMSYATLFVNKNFPKFKDWIVGFINKSNSCF